MTVLFTCSHREISFCLLLETSCQRPPLEVVSVSTAHKSQYFWLLCHSSGAWGVLWAVTDVGVGLRGCTSLLFAAAVQHWNLRMGLVLFVLFCALPSFLLFLSVFQKMLFSTLQPKKRLSRAQRKPSILFKLDWRTSVFFLALSGVN